MKQWLGRLAVTAAVMTALVPAMAQAWWQDDWAYRKQLTLDTSSAGADLKQAGGRMAVLLRLHAGNLGFEDAREDGADLRFVGSDDQTVYPHHVESFDPLLGIATVWVDIPDLAPGAARDLWLYYGNPQAAAADDAAAGLDADYRAVLRFGEAAAAPPQDSTAYGNHALNPPPASSEAALIAGGARFDGRSGFSLPASDALKLAADGALSVSVWLRMEGPQAAAVIYGRSDAGGALHLLLEQGVPAIEVRNGNTVQRAAAASALGAGQWTHLALVADGASVKLYVDGRPAAEVAAALPALATPTSIGIDSDGSRGFSGELDELRLSAIARPEAALLADVLSQAPESRLVRFGADEEQSGHGGYFGVIVASVTIDAWIVIGILGLMAVISWYVMYAKGAYASRVQNANDAFMAHFRKLGRNLMGLQDTPLPADEREQLAHSSLFRLYEVGTAEIRSRIDDGEGHALSAESIEAIRASMDATLVRENQRLSHSMVLLTIAISGGPFLGLLGTVVGVMITFAAIAAAGDVNVNAIAPGISAALLATVAGLGVAIPALFGYNYLLGRNKNVSANMQVFVDEFVTRMAELYRSGPAHAHPL